MPIDFGELTAHFGEIFVPLFPAISQETWTDKDWTPEQKLALNTFMKLVDDLFNDKLCRQYNRTIWNGHKSGKVAKTLEPLRAETVRKNGADKTAPDAAAIFAAATGTVTS